MHVDCTFWKIRKIEKRKIETPIHIYPIQEKYTDIMSSMWNCENHKKPLKAAKASSSETKSKCQVSFRSH